MRRTATRLTLTVLAIAYAASVFVDARGAIIEWSHEILPILVPAVAGVRCVAAARRADDTKKMWLLFGLGAFAWAIGDTAYTVFERLGIDPGALSPADVAYLALIPAWTGAVLLHPARSRQPENVAGAAINAMIFAVATGTLTVAFVVRPILADGIETPGTLVNLAYPVGDLALLGALAAVVAQSPFRLRSSASLLVGAVFVFAAGDIWYAYLTLTDGYDVGSPVDLTWIAAFVLLVLAQDVRPRSGATDDVASTPTVAAALVPSLPAVFLTVVLAVAALFSEDDAILFAGASAVALLILVRYALVIVLNARLSRELEARLSELRRLTEAQNEFVGAASHQLRTPLTSIRLLLDETDATGAGSLAGRTALDQIKSEVERLQDLSERLLVLLDADRVRTTARVRLRDAIDEAIERVVPVAQTRSVVLTHNENGTSLVVDASEAAVAEVLLNVLDNAVKHSPAGGRITVRTAARGRMAVVRVEDQGGGIQPAEVERVFRPFHRSPQSTGFGLGLPIAKRLVEAAGGSITLEPGDAGGTTVTLAWRIADESVDLTDR